MKFIVQENLEVDLLLEKDCDSFRDTELSCYSAFKGKIQHTGGAMF